MQDFFEKYDDRIMPEPMSGCFLWTGSWAKSGYGNFTRYNRTHYAHRSAYEAIHGVGSAKGLVVRHRCDNRCCCNPDHLEIGTQKDNCDDAWRRGRMKPAVGEDSSRATITAETVMRARDLARRGMPVCDVAAVLSLEWKVADCAIRGKTWRHLPRAVPNPTKAGFRTINPHGERSPTAKLTQAQVDNIRTSLSKGAKGVDLALRFNVSTATISAIKVGRNWAR